MSLRARFLLSLLALLTLIALPALYGVGRVYVLRDVVLELRGQSAQAALVAGQLQAALSDVNQYQRAYVVTGDAEMAGRMRAALARAAGAVSKLREAGYGDVADGVELDLQELQRVTSRIEGLVEAGALDAATDYLLAAAAPLVQQAQASVPGLAAAIDEKTTERAALAQRTATATGTAATVAFIIALALAGVLALMAADVLTRPLEGLRVAMARVAEGAFEAPTELPYERSDELGDLSRSFRTMTLRLAELDRLKAEFVGTASHDLKTPISVITGYAALMQEELDTSLGTRHKELLRSLAEQTQSLQRRVDQLLEISRMEAGRLRLGLEEINVRHFAGEIRRAYEPIALTQGIRLEVSVHDSTPPFLIADPDLLRTDVIGNLMGNALKFTPAGGLIRVSVRRDAERLHIEVADTGRGIAQDQIDHIFEKYYQGRRANGGAGLGLAIARSAVEAHGGRIEAQSCVGRGSRFRAILPLRAAVPSPTDHQTLPRQGVVRGA